jgi:hypothetical protein
MTPPPIPTAIDALEFVNDAAARNRGAPFASVASVAAALIVACAIAPNLTGQRQTSFR